MSSSPALVAALAEIAQRSVWIAVFWHAAIVLGVIAFGLGWRVSRMKALCLMSLPVMSVSALAWLHGNPFNGAIFAALAVVMLIAALSLPPATVENEPGWPVVAGGLLVAFAFVYPHFLDELPALSYLAAAPLGVLPCPTLALIVGLMLAGGGMGSRTLSLGFATVAGFYSLFGFLVLGVEIDLVLLAGAGALAILVATPAWRTRMHGAV
jgi:hypothetical protein